MCNFLVYPHVRSSLSVAYAMCVRVCFVFCLRLSAKFAQLLSTVSLFVSEMKASAGSGFHKVSWDCLCKSFVVFKHPSSPSFSLLKKPLWLVFRLLSARRMCASEPMNGARRVFGPRNVYIVKSASGFSDIWWPCQRMQPTNPPPPPRLSPVHVKRVEGAAIKLKNRVIFHISCHVFSTVGCTQSLLVIPASYILPFCLPCLVFVCVSGRSVLAPPASHLSPVSMARLETLWKNTILKWISRLRVKYVLFFLK